MSAFIDRHLLFLSRQAPNCKPRGFPVGIITVLNDSYFSTHSPFPFQKDFNNLDRDSFHLT